MMTEEEVISKLETFKKAIDGLKNTINALREKNNGLVKEANDAKLALAEAEKAHKLELEKLQVEALKSDLSEKDKTIHVLKVENNNLRVDLNDLRDTIDSLRLQLSSKRDIEDDAETTVVKLTPVIKEDHHKTVISVDDDFDTDKLPPADWIDSHFKLTTIDGEVFNTGDITDEADQVYMKALSHLSVQKWENRGKGFIYAVEVHKDWIISRFTNEELKDALSWFCPQPLTK